MEYRIQICRQLIEWWSSPTAWSVMFLPIFRSLAELKLNNVFYISMYHWQVIGYYQLAFPVLQRMNVLFFNTWELFTVNFGLYPGIYQVILSLKNIYEACVTVCQTCFHCRSMPLCQISWVLIQRLQGIYIAAVTTFLCQILWIIYDRFTFFVLCWLSKGLDKKND